MALALAVLIALLTIISVGVFAAHVARAKKALRPHGRDLPV